MEKHKCTLDEDETQLEGLSWFQRFRLISLDNPLRLSSFSSNILVRKEQIRQMKVNKCAIHPFSKFRAWYEMYLIWLYGAVLITKPMDAAFVKLRNCTDERYVYIYYNILTDILCWIDIFINFFVGYDLYMESSVELRKWAIVKHYVLGPYFICDVLSSVPKCAVYNILYQLSYRRKIFGITTILGMFKIVRIVSFVKYIWRTAGYMHSKSHNVIGLVCSIFGCVMIIHWLACMQFAVPRLCRIYFADHLRNNSWFYAPSVYKGTLYTGQTLLVRYNHALFKSSAHIMGINPILYELKGPEEYVLAHVTFLVGRVLVAFMWIILLRVILNSRATEIQLAEIVNQVVEYMKQKQIPAKLQNRIVQHYLFKYQQGFFKEDLMLSLLSDRLRKEIAMHTCRSLIENVPLFSDLTSHEIQKIVTYLIPVIFLPGDIFFQAGSVGDAMYFIASGTVAVYTRSGKEVCHVQDGAYFGEIALILKNRLRIATVVALEHSYVYRLNKKDMQKCFLSNEGLMFKILRKAEEKLRNITRQEEGYKKAIYDASVRSLPVLRH